MIIRASHLYLILSSIGFTPRHPFIIPSLILYTQYNHRIPLLESYPDARNLLLLKYLFRVIMQRIHEQNRTSNAETKANEQL